MITAKLTWTIVCEDCKRKITESFDTDWFSGFSCGHLSEEDISGDNAIESARGDGWKFERLSYEELAAYCPNCASWKDE